MPEYLPKKKTLKSQRKITSLNIFYDTFLSVKLAVHANVPRNN